MPEVDQSIPQHESNTSCDRCRNIVLAWIPVIAVITILFIFTSHLYASLITFIILLFMITLSFYYVYGVMTPIEPIEEHLTQMGLSPSIIKELPTFVYQQNSRDLNSCNRCDKTGLRCAVCIATVRNGDLVRQLLMCKHVFHTDCIDTWLPSHSTCPMCRADVKPGKLSSEQQPESPEPPV